MDCQEILDPLISIVNLFSVLGPREHYFATCKDQQHHLRLGHPKDQPRKQLWLVPAVFLTRFHCSTKQSFQFNIEANIVRADYILNLKI